MRKLFSILVIGALSLLHAQAARMSAAQVMDRTAACFTADKSYRASFNASSGGQTTTGTLELKGEKFRLRSGELVVWYDGTTQWSYLTDTREVNISEPTPEELVEINPFVILANFRKNYNARLLDSAKDTYRIDLTPKNADNSQIKRAIVTVGASAFLPREIAVTLSDGKVIAIRISRIDSGVNLPASTFVFSAKEYPKAEIIDLR